MSATETGTETIDPHYTGEWGWHKIHKISPKEFLKGTPFPKKTDICVKCHSEDTYEIFNPHIQLNENGDVIKEKCVYCHIKKPDEIRANYQDVKFVLSLRLLCPGCHYFRRSHPANANHLLKPSAETLAMMKEVRQEFGIILPLDNNGEVVCITCHNPHEKGVIPAERFGARGASEEFRHRLPGKMCLACHEK